MAALFMHSKYLLISAIVLHSGSSFGQRPPQVYLVYPAPYGSIFDRGCPDLLKAEVQRERHTQEIDETVRRRSEFQQEWDRYGTRYLTAAMQEIRLPYPYREVQVTLTICPIPSMGDPLVVNVRSYLSKAQHPSPAWRFAFTVFHELMHTYVRPVTSTSDLRKKYSSEPLQIVNHLHVLALEKLVLVKLQQLDKLRELDDFYRMRASGPYRRAWEIVTSESHDAFVRELKLVRNH